MEYGFNLVEIANKKEQLESCLEKTNDVDERKKIELTLDLYNTILYNFSKKNNVSITIDVDSDNMELINELKLLIQNDSFTPEYRSVRNVMCEKLYKMAIDKTSNIYSYSELNLDKGQYVELVGDMIKKKLGMNHYNIFKNLFVNNPSHIEFTNLFGSLIYSVGIDNSFVIINDSNNINTAQDLAHEAGHYYASRQNNRYIENSTILDEFESHFYELLFIDYLIEENIYKHDAYQLFLSLLDSVVVDKASMLHALYTYPMYKINSVKDFKIMANTYDLYNKTSLLSTHELLNYIVSSENTFTYIYSTIVALELFNEYKISRNKKSVVARYERFVKEIGSVPDFKLVSYINKDYVSFDNFKNLKKYHNKILELY